MKESVSDKMHLEQHQKRAEEKKQDSRKTYKLQGWRWAYYLAGAIGIGLAVLYFFTVQEPERVTGPGAEDEVWLPILACFRWRNSATNAPTASEFSLKDSN